MRNNPNIADISAFENLQTQANVSMGTAKPQSQMGVFNVSADVQEIQHVCSDLVEAIDDCLPAWAKYRQTLDRYNQTVKTVMDRRKREAESAAAAKKQGNPEPQKTFDREQSVIQDSWRKVVGKQAEIQRLK